MLGRLDECGCDCVAVETGREALAFYQWGFAEVDLVFLNLNLPDSFATEVLAALYQINPQVRVVVMSGYLSDPVQLIYTPGVAALLLKPFSFNEFNEILLDTSAVRGTA